MRRMSILAAACLLAASLAGPASAASPATRGFLPAVAHPHGYSLVELSTAWNAWAFQPPEATNPIVAARCEQSALDPKIWFLPVSMGVEQTATCDVPQGAFLVLVLGGTICATMTGDGDTVADLVACVERDASRPSYAEAVIDGRTTTDVADYWVITEPIWLAGPNVFSPDAGWAVAATYTMVIAPLSRGIHTIRAYDEFVAQDFTAGTTFTVTVR